MEIVTKAAFKTADENKMYLYPIHTIVTDNCNVETHFRSRIDAESKSLFNSDMGETCALSLSSKNLNFPTIKLSHKNLSERLIIREFSILKQIEDYYNFFNVKGS